MRILPLLKKELLHLLQTPQSLFMMILFPIALTWVLGMGLSSISTRVIDLPEMAVPLVETDSSFGDVYRDNAAPVNIDFVPMTQAEALERFERGENENIVFLESGTIRHLTSTSDKSLENLMIRMYSSAFSHQANLFSYVSRHGRPDLMPLEVNDQVELKGIATQAEPSSFDYYGVTMLTLIMMYGTLQAAELVGFEARNRTNIRLKTSPTPMTLIFGSKVIAAILILTLQASIIVAANSLVFGVNYGHLGQLAALLIPYGVFTCSLGIALNQLASKLKLSEGIMVFLINLFLFVGGAYFPVDQLGVIGTLQQYSPVKWINEAIFQSVYQGLSEKIVPLGIRFGLISVVLLVVAGYLFSQRGADYVRID
ncbi:MAG TPA: ABC transporter permease [Tissierellia bacterium]|nr:ABC transporter permease [Tissierellia bacterium]